MHPSDLLSFRPSFHRLPRRVILTTFTTLSTQYKPIIGSNPSVRFASICTRSVYERIPSARAI